MTERFKLAFSTNAFSRHSLESAINCIAVCGYAGVEILADKPHLYPDRFSPRRAAKIQAVLSRKGLAISNINANCTFGYWKDAPPEPFFEPSLISPVRQYRAVRAEMIANTLRYAHALGAANISITSGKALPTVPPDKARRQLKESLKPLLDLAHKLNVRIGIESEPGLLIEWAAELAELISVMGSPLLGANLDIGHSVVIGEPLGHTLRLLRGRIWNCHIEDLVGRKHYHLIPGRGNLNWAGLKRQLAVTRYPHFLTVELYTCPDKPRQAAKESMAFLKPIFRAQQAGAPTKPEPA